MIRSQSKLLHNQDSALRKGASLPCNLLQTHSDLCKHLLYPQLFSTWIIITLCFCRQVHCNDFLSIKDAAGHSFCLDSFITEGGRQLNQERTPVTKFLFWYSHSLGHLCLGDTLESNKRKPCLNISKQNSVYLHTLCRASEKP